MTRGDLLLVLIAMGLIGLMYTHFWQAPTTATWVEVRSADQPVQRYSLREPRRITIQGRVGNSVLEVREGAVRFRSGPCRNQVCVHSGWLRHGGDTAACLPNRVSIRLIGGEQEIDGVS